MDLDRSEDEELPSVAARPAFGLTVLTLVALGAVLTVVTWPAPLRPVDVSFCNGSSIRLLHVNANGVEFGYLAPTACSGFHRLTRIHAQPSFYFSDGIEGHGGGPEDHIDDKPLPSGRYQFVIEGQGLALQAKLRPGAETGSTTTNR